MKRPIAKPELSLGRRFCNHLSDEDRCDEMQTARRWVQHLVGVCFFRLSRCILAEVEAPPRAMRSTVPGLGLRLTLLGATAICSLALNAHSLDAQEVISRERKIKAAYLYNFAKFIQFPDHYERLIKASDRYVTIGIVGNSSIDEYLRTIARRKTVNGKQLQVINFPTPADIEPCHVLYIPSSLPHAVQLGAIRHAGSQSSFVIAESDSLISAVEAAFYSETNRIRFSINTVQTERSDIRVSSRLLSLGRIVRAESPQPNR